MEWDSAIDLSKRKYTSRLIVQRALARGWRVRGFETNPAIFLLYIPGRPKPLKIFSASPPQTAYPSVKIAKDKYITNLLLAEAGIPVPKELLVEPTAIDEATLQNFLTEAKEVVIKPLNAAHGKGITTNVRELSRLQQAIAEANNVAPKSKVIVQEQLTGHDIRILTIDYQYIDAYTRIPAHVTGDGHHTLTELIELANQSPDRGEEYKARLNRIPISEVKKFVSSTALTEVAPAGQVVQVVGVSNIGMGGERRNISQTIPPFLKELASKAAQLLELPICGTDFMVKQLPTAESTFEQLQPKLIEANECPSLTQYDDLSSPAQLAIIDAYLDYLSSH